MGRSLDGKSDLEEAFVFWLRVEQMPRPVRELVFASPRKWRLDFAWPDQMVAVEIEGLTYDGGGRHQRVAGFVADCEKYEAALRCGWRVYRVPGRWVHDQRPGVMETLRILLDAL